MDQQPASNQAPVSAPGSNKGMITTLIAVLAIAVAGIGYAMFGKKPQSNNQIPPEGGSVPDETGTGAPSAGMPVPPATSSGAVAPDMTVTEDTGTPEASEYKDGTYTAVGNYVSPGGPEQVGVTLTLENDVITDAQFEIKATRPISLDKQTIFSQNFKPQVVGKDIDDVNVTKVSSSSLTPKGFMDAVNQIKEDAQG